MAKRTTGTGTTNTNDVTAAVRQIIDQHDGDELDSIVIGLALWLRARIDCSTDDDLSDDQNEFHDRVYAGIMAAKQIRADSTGDDDTRFTGQLPGSWAEAKTAVNSIITGVAWGDE